MKNVALIDLPKEEVMTFFEKHNAAKSASGDQARAALLLDCLIFTYAKCGYKLTKSIIDEEMTDNPFAKSVIMNNVRAAAEAQYGN